MDSLVAAAARALMAGDAITALKHIALRDEPPALALRGIAMAQLGDYPRARQLLRQAARRFGTHEALARARCSVAEAEVALAMRDVAASAHGLERAIEDLQVRGDSFNAWHAQLVAVRRQVLLGRLDTASAGLDAIDVASLPPPLAAVAHLARAEILLRRVRTHEAGRELDFARLAAQQARIPALLAEVAELESALTRTAAHVIQEGGSQALRLVEVEDLLASPALVVDACRRSVRVSDKEWSLTRRPLLFALLLGLARAWPADEDRNVLIREVFRSQQPDESHRARLRVELGRLRKLLAPQAEIVATSRGFRLHTPQTQGVVVLLPPIEGGHSALAAGLLALLADGQAWSTSALALAMGDSQRTVQRALVELETASQVRSIGRARAQRWLAAPLRGFTTILLLPAALPV